jgi:hypothetical protein
MKKTILIAAMFSASLYGMATVLPFPGGVVVIMYDPTPGGPCPRAGVTMYPKRTVQYWFDGVDLSRILTDGERVIATRIPMENFSGYSSIYDAAARVDKHEYACQYRLEFQPGDQQQMDVALAANRIKVGRLKNEGDFWYWSP